MSFRLSPSGRDPFGWFRAACACDACRVLRSDTGLIETAEEMAVLSAQLMVSRSATDDGENGTDRFLAEELRLSSTLLSAVAEPFDTFRKTVAEIVSGPHKQSDILGAVEAATPGMGGLFEPVEDTVRSITDTTLLRGGADVMAGVVNETNGRALVREGIVRAARYYTNTFFNTMVVPDIQAMMDKVLADPASNLQSPDFAPLKAVLDKRLKTVPYWRVVANAAASRAYHYGYLKALNLTGVQGYKLYAVLDAKTSDVCLFLNGRTFWVRDAVDLLEEINADDDPEAAKKRSPWLTGAEVEKLSAFQLKALGVMVPPFHGNCRTTIRPIGGTPELF